MLLEVSPHQELPKGEKADRHIRPNLPTWDPGDRVAVERPHVVAVFHLATTHVQGELATRIQTMVEEMESSIHGRFDQRIRQAIADGELDVESAEDVHVFLGVFFHGVLFLQTNCPHQVGPMNERLEQVWRLLFRGISGREPKESLNA